jgi:Ala-tRNA(Pro) deacylase
MATQQLVRAEKGDLIEVSGRRVGDRIRTGEILEALGSDEHLHFLIRWEDGHESILYPGEGTTIRHARRGPAAEPAPALEPAAPDRLVEDLRRAGCEFELLRHRRTLTAAAEARALGVVEQEVAKTVIVRDEQRRHIRAVVPASLRLDLDKLAAATGARSVSLLSEPDLISAYPQFELGAVPPFGGPGGDSVVVDRTVAAADLVVLEAGVHDVSLRLAADELVRICDAKVSDISREEQ